MSFNISDILSKKITLIIIAAIIGVVVLLYKFNMLGILLPKKTTIEAKDQNNSEIKIYDEVVPSDTLQFDTDSVPTN